MKPILHSVLPALLVPDVRRTAAYYRDVLGFRVCMIVGRDPHLFSIVDLAEGEGFHFKHDAGRPARRNRSAGGQGLDAYVRVSDADTLFTRWRERGAKTLGSPVDRPWRMREFELEDCDGHVLAVGGDLTGSWPAGKVATSPEFAVRDVARTLAFYREQLGFDDCAAFSDPPGYGIACRDGVRIHLARADSEASIRPNRPVAGVWDAFVEVSGLDAWLGEIRERGVRVVRGPETTAYEMRELELDDPDGYALCFGEPTGGWGAR